MQDLKSLSNNNKYKLCNNILINLSKILIIIILSRTLLTNEFGLYILLFSIIEVGNTISNIGLPTAVTFFVSKFYNNNKELSYSYIKYSLIMKVLITLIVSFTLFFIILFIYNVQEIKLIVISSIVIFLYSFCLYFEYIFAGLNNYKKYFIWVTLPKELILISSIVILFYFQNINLDNILLIYLYSLVIATILGLMNLNVRLFKSNIKLINKPNYWKFVFSIAPNTLAGALFYWTDTFFITGMLGVEELAKYNIAYRLISIGVTIMPISSITTLAFLNTLSIQSRIKNLKIILKQTYALILPIIFFIINFSKEIIMLLYGSKFVESSIVLIIASTLLMERIISPILKNTLIANNKVRIITLILPINCIINVILNYTLISLFGITGAILATVISSYIGFILYVIILIKYKFLEIDIKMVILSTVASMIFIIPLFINNSILVQIIVFSLSGIMYGYFIHLNNLLPYELKKIFFIFKSKKEYLKSE